MKLSILVIEDDPLNIISIKSKILELGHHDPYISDHHSNFKLLIQQLKPQLVITDIYYELKPVGLKMIEICNANHIPLILVTADTRNTTHELAIKYNGIAYLVKPFHHFTLQTCIDMAMAAFVSKISPDKYIFVNDHNNKKVKLNLKEIHWLESDGNFCHINSACRRFIVRRSLSKLSNELDEQFIQVHKSYIVNKDLINKITCHSLVIDQQEIPIGRKYKRELLASIPVLRK